MEGHTRQSVAHDGSPSEASTSRLQPARSELAPGSVLHHKPSLTNTQSTSSASSSSHHNHAVSSHAPHHTASQSTQTHSATSTQHQPTRPRKVPVYIRIVPKDIWLRVHLDPTQSIGSIKDLALSKVRAPNHDPSLSYRFYQDALNASAHAKLAPVASHDKVVKHRSYALPRTFVCPPPDLTDVTGSLAAALGDARRKRKLSRSTQGASTPSTSSVPPVPSLPIFDKSYSPRAAPQQALAAARSGSDDVLHPGAVQVHRQVSNSTLATSPSSTPSDFGAISNAEVSSDMNASDTSHSQSNAASEIAIDLDVSLITGNRNAKLEEDMARMRLSQWNATRATSGSHATQEAKSLQSLMASPHLNDSLSQSFNSTPTIASSSQFDGSSSGFSPRMGSSSSNVAYGHSGPTQIATPPRRSSRSDAAVGTAPAIFYTQPGAAESFNSLASVSSPSSNELVTTADDDAAVMQWGTQAEMPLLEQASPSKSAASSDFSSLSSPQTSAAVAAALSSSPARPRSRTITVADVLRSRGNGGEEPPPLPNNVSSPQRKSSLPQVQIKKMVAESSQRRAMPTDLFEMLKGAPDNDDDDEDDGDMGISTLKQRRVLRKKSSNGSTSGPLAGGAAFSSPSSSLPATMDSGDRYIAGIRMDEISRGIKDPSHPLSAKYAVLSSANGCELEEWKTVAASQIRPYELLDLQWAIPTERVYIMPMSPQDMIRAPSSGDGGRKAGLFKQSWNDDMDAGPDPEAACLDPYFEGWVYVLEAKRSSKSSSKTGKWKLHWITIKGWRADLYRKKPRAGEAVLPIAEQSLQLRSIDWVVETENAVPSMTALPALDTIPTSSLTIALSTKGGNVATSNTLSSPNSSAGDCNEGSHLTLRCVTHFDHEALSSVLMRAWYRCSATSFGVDVWRRKALFRALVAGRGGTVPVGRAGRGRLGRNAMARMRLRPSGWPKEWEDADQWSSESEREEVAPPPELEHSIEQQRRRDTVTQLRANRAKKRAEEETERGVVPNGLYAALLGRTPGMNAPPTTATGLDSESQGASTTRGYASQQESSPYQQGGLRSKHTPQTLPLPQKEPGLMLGNHALHKQHARQRSGSLSRSPRLLESSPDPSGSTEASIRSRSLTVSSANKSSTTCRGRSNTNSAASSRNVSREASPLPSGSGSRKSSAGNFVTAAPPIAAGWTDVPPPPSLALLKKFKASQKGGGGSKDG